MFDNPVFVVILLVIVAALGAAAGFFAGRAKGQDMARGAKESDLNEAKAQIEADKQDISDLNAAVVQYRTQAEGFSQQLTYLKSQLAQAQRAEEMRVERERQRAAEEANRRQAESERKLQEQSKVLSALAPVQKNLDALQTKMIRSNTRRQLYLGITIASHIYFIGDAAVNYSTNDVSNVKKATTLACIFPGAGQIYNRSYWKVPFVVGGFASMIYCIDWNNRGFQRFKKAYNLLADYEQHPDKYPNGPTDEFQGRYSASYIKNMRDNFRRNRDLCIIISGALYALQIIDAHVDAHLKDYDISDDLTMNLEPLVDYPYIPSMNANRPVFGFNMSLKF